MCCPPVCSSVNLTVLPALRGANHGGVTLIPEGPEPELTFGSSHERPFAGKGYCEQMFAPNARSWYGPAMTDLTPRRRQVLEFVDSEVRHRGYPPSVREIGEAVGLSSSSTVHAHLAALQDKGYLTRDPTKPRAIEVRFDVESGAAVDRRPVRHVPLLGDVAAGTAALAPENVEEILPLPEDFTGRGQLFMLRVRGDSMIEAGIFDGDYVVVRQQGTAEPGEKVVAGIPGEEATVKTFSRRRGKIVLKPANEAMDELVYDPDDVLVYGKVVTVLRTV